MSALGRMHQLLTAAKSLAEDEEHLDLLLYLLAMAILEVESKITKQQSSSDDSNDPSQPN